MENTTTPRSQMAVSLRFGIITGLVTTVVFLILYVFNLETNRAVNWVNTLLLVIIMFWGIKDYRDKDLGGYISFGKAFSTGVLIALFTGIISALFTLIFISFVDTHFIRDIIEQQIQQMEAKGMTQEQIDMAVKYTKMFTTPLLLSVFTILGTCFFGLIISLIESLILKKENPEMPQA